MILQDWGALENWKIREGWGLFGSDRAFWGIDGKIKEQQVMGAWGCCVYVRTA